MNYNDAEKVRQMIAGHWNLRMDDATCDLWLGALLPKAADVAVKAVSRLAKTDARPPRISDLEEVYLMLTSAEPIPATEICQTCGGDQFVLIGLRRPVRTQWMEDHGLEPAEKGMQDEWAPCPDCNSECNTSFPRHDGTVFNSPDPGLVRERMAPAVRHPVPKGAQKIPDDIKTYLRDMRGTTGDFTPVDPGSCEQCTREGERYEYGEMKLCERCRSQREKVAARLAADEEQFLSVLRDVT